MPVKSRLQARTANDTAVQSLQVVPQLRIFLDSFRCPRLAENKSPRTVKTYMEAAGLFCELLQGKGMPTDLQAIHREHIEAFIADLLARGRRPVLRRLHK